MKFERLLASIICGLGLTLASLWLLTVGQVPLVYADTYTVTNTDPSGPGSLRQAILDANGNAGHDTIDFGITGTIVLTGALPVVSDDLTITGPGATHLAVSGDNQFRVFEIANSTAVTMTGLTVRDGHIAGNGGGIYNDGNLLLQDMQVVSNSANYGGGVYVFDSNATLSVSGGGISHNSASDNGAGVFVDRGSATLSGTQVISNSVSYFGGGVYVLYGNVTLSGTQVLGNSAYSGGGVYVYLGNATLNKTQMLNNSASYSGGGVYVYLSYATLNISGGKIVHNSAYDGGGVYVADGSATLSGTQVVSNSAYSGGGACVGNGGTLNVSEGEIDGNSASSHGGGVSVWDGSATLSGTQVASNLARWGGGASVWDSNTTLNVSGGRIDGNSALSGGGVYVWYGSAALSGTQVISNVADEDGGGLYVYQGGAMLSGTQVVSNVANGSDLLDDGGGGVFVDTISATLNVNGGRIDSNSANFGGGVFVRDGSATLSGTQVVSNWAYYYGGGVYVRDGSATLNGTQVVSNSVRWSGGGVYVQDSSATFTQTNGVIGYNSTSYNGHGGGVYIDQGSVTLSGTLVIGNRASSSGGGVHIQYGSATLSKTQVVSNSASKGGGGSVWESSAKLSISGGGINHNSASWGGGVYVEHGSTTLSGTQVISNVVDEDGGGVCVDQGSVTLNGTRVISNSAALRGGGVYVADGSATLRGTQVVSNSADSGGGVYVDQGSATLNETQVVSNSARWGGGVYVDQGSATLNETQVVSNSARWGGGGVNVSSGSVTLSKTQVVNNLAYWGGGVRVTSDSTMLSVSGGEISSNSATDGGGVYVSSGSVTLSETQVINNLASERGGGVYVYWSGATFTQTGGMIGYNSANKGGGVCVYQGSATLSGTQVVSNLATGGGGVYVYWSGATFTQTSGMIGYNLAYGSTFLFDGGGGVYVDQGSATLSGTQVVGNSTSRRGGGVNIYQGSASLSGTRIADNDAPDGSGVYQHGGAITLTAPLTVVGEVYQNDGIFSGSNNDLHIEGSLQQAGGHFYAPNAPNDFTLTGPFTHTGGTYRQTQVVTGSSDVGFPKAGGVILNANNHNLGSTEVVLTAGANCAGVTASEAVAHCYIITPTTTTGRDTAVTFYYNNSEVPYNQDCVAMEAFRWDATWNNRLTRDGSYGTDGRMCAGDPLSIRVTGVMTFSPFVLKGLLVPEITVFPSFLSFGGQDVDVGPTVSQTVIITNDGTANLYVSNVSLTGTDAGEFVIENDTGEYPLAPGNTRTVQVSFDPTTTGIKSANLTIQSDDSDESTIDVPLSGTGTSTANTYTLTVSKDGTGGGTISSIPAGINCGIACQVNFVEGAVVTLTATSDTGSTFTGWVGEECSGTGVCQVIMDAARQVTATFHVAAGYPGYGSTPASGSVINIGVTDVGSTISTTLTINETGDVTLVVTSTLSGVDAGDFGIAPSTLTIPDGGAAQDLVISCTPSVTGMLAATLTVAHNAPGSPALYPLSCTGGTLQSIYLPLVLRDH